MKWAYLDSRQPLPVHSSPAISLPRRDYNGWRSQLVWVLHKEHTRTHKKLLATTVASLTLPPVCQRFETSYRIQSLASVWINLNEMVWSEGHMVNLWRRLWGGGVCVTRRRSVVSRNGRGPPWRGRRCRAEHTSCGWRWLEGQTSLKISVFSVSCGGQLWHRWPCDIALVRDVAWPPPVCSQSR